MEVLENDEERPAVAREPAEQVEEQLAQPALAVAVGEPRRAGAGRVEPEARQQRGELGAASSSSASASQSCGMARSAAITGA